MNIPAELKYSKSHEWVKMDGDVAVIGISDFAQDALGDVVFINLPAEGAWRMRDPHQVIPLFAGTYVRLQSSSMYHMHLHLL